MPKVAFVVQRYGSEVIGGAETHARLIAEYLHDQQGWEIEVFTTTALDYQTWKNFYPAGTGQVNSVVVHRFPCLFPRFILLFKIYSRLVSPILRFAAGHLGKNFFGRLLVQSLEYLWYVLQGPYSPRLLQALKLRKDSFEKVFFFTYLYYPTIYGFPLCKEKAVIIPTAHDEYPLFFPQSKKILAEAPILLVNTDEEESLIRSVLKGKKNKILKVGVGVEANYAKKFKIPHSAALASLPAQPYILYLGRVSRGKGVHELIRVFISYLERAPESTLQLLIAGVQEQRLQIPEHPSIHYLGQISEERKVHLVRNAVALVNPSTKESLSLIVLEALAMQTPIIVNGSCKVLNSYQRHVSTVLPYTSAASFARQIAFSIAHYGDYRWQLQLKRSQNWVLRHYSWEKVLRSYQRALNYQNKVVDGETLFDRKHSTPDPLYLKTLQKI
jgi:glycosyltransferase involved in cell wall biosynthesis